MTFQNTLEFAKTLDSQDPLKEYRNEFFFLKLMASKQFILLGIPLDFYPLVQKSM